VRGASLLGSAFALFQVSGQALPKGRKLPKQGGALEGQVLKISVWNIVAEVGGTSVSHASMSEKSRRKKSATHHHSLPALCVSQEVHEFGCGPGGLLTTAVSTP